VYACNCNEVCVEGKGYYPIKRRFNMDRFIYPGNEQGGALL